MVRKISQTLLVVVRVPARATATRVIEVHVDGKKISDRDVTATILSGGYDGRRRPTS